MLFNGKDVSDYSPTELLELCKVDIFETGEIRYWTTQILALIVCEKDNKILIEKLGDLIQTMGDVSIGKALRKLHTISEIGPELQGGLTGIDALTYHLSDTTCRHGIDALQRVLDQFNIDTQKKELLTNGQ